MSRVAVKPQLKFIIAVKHSELEGTATNSSLNRLKYAEETELNDMSFYVSV